MWSERARGRWRRAARLVALVPLCASLAWAPAEGKQLLGTRAPSWEGLTWIAGGPVTLESRHGRPVLVRFWSDGCPMCAETAPALNQLQRRYGARGLTVVAIHHPKSPEAHDAAFVARAARQIGLACPVATDPDWRTLKAYGVGTVFQKFTSVSFLIDGDGRIAFVHDGGSLTIGSEAYRALTDAIERALPRPAR